MKKLIVCIFVLLFTLPLFAQEKPVTKPDSTKAEITKPAVDSPLLQRYTKEIDMLVKAINDLQSKINDAEKQKEQWIGQLQLRQIDKKEEEDRLVAAEKVKTKK